MAPVSLAEQVLCVSVGIRKGTPTMWLEGKTEIFNRKPKGHHSFPSGSEDVPCPHGQDPPWPCMVQPLIPTSSLVSSHSTSPPSTSAPPGKLPHRAFALAVHSLEFSSSRRLHNPHSLSLCSCAPSILRIFVVVAINNLNYVFLYTHPSISILLLAFFFFLLYLSSSNITYN